MDIGQKRQTRTSAALPGFLLSMIFLFFFSPGVLWAADREEALSSSEPSENSENTNARGGRTNPYANIREAAYQITGRLASTLEGSNLFDEPVRLAIARKGATTSEMEIAFINALSFHGVERMVPSKESADLFLILDAEEMSEGRIFLKASLLSVRNGGVQRNETGCFFSNAMTNSFDATGIGRCNRRLEPEQRKERANKEAERDARRSLAKKIKQVILAREASRGEMVDEDYLDSVVLAYMEKAKSALIGYDEEKCESRVRVTITREDAASATETDLPPRRRARDVETAYQRGQLSMIRDLNSYLRDRLRQEQISPWVIRLISVRGRLDLPDCRVEDHYLAPKGVPPRHYCDVNYDLTLSIGDEGILVSRGRAEGMGSSRDAAWEDAILGVEDELHPLILEIAAALNKRSTDAVPKALANIGDYPWSFPESLNRSDVLDILRDQKAETND